MVSLGLRRLGRSILWLDQDLLLALWRLMLCLIGTACSLQLNRCRLWSTSLSPPRSASNHHHVSESELSHRISFAAEEANVARLHTRPIFNRNLRPFVALKLASRSIWWIGTFRILPRL